VSGMFPHQIQRTITIDAASGVAYAFVPSEDGVGKVRGYQGLSRGAGLRLDVNSGWDVATLQLWILDYNEAYIDLDNLEADPDDYPEDIQIFRSDATAPGDANGSATAATIDETWANLPIAFSRGYVIAVAWTTSGGSGEGEVVVTVDQEVAVP
jgi:hypothetical protein